MKLNDFDQEKTKQDPTVFVDFDPSCLPHPYCGHRWTTVGDDFLCSCNKARGWKTSARPLQHTLQTQPDMVGVINWDQKHAQKPETTGRRFILFRKKAVKKRAVGAPRMHPQLLGAHIDVALFFPRPSTHVRSISNTIPKSFVTIFNKTSRFATTLRNIV